MAGIVPGAADVDALVVFLDGAEVERAADLVHNAPLAVVRNLHLAAPALREAKKSTRCTDDNQGPRLVS